jgi:glycosyltransferase involved in cell wall biosynthesis
MASNNGLSGKRVLLLLPEVFGASGGIQMYCRSLCLAVGEWAQRNNSTVSAIVLNDNAPPDTRYVNGRFDTFTTVGKSKSRFIKSFMRQVAASRHDVLICGHVSLAPLALASRLFNPGIKTVVVTYGVDVWRPLSTLDRSALRNADKVLAISEFTRDEVVERHSVPRERIDLFPPSLDPFWQVDMPSQESQATPPMILTVGRLERSEVYKGVDSVIKSLPAVVAEYGAVDYRVVGKGDDVPRLKALAEELSVSEYVTFTGGVSEQELRDYYRRCSLFVMPSEKEGFGIVFLEAMAYGKPVVGGAHCGTPSVVRDGVTGLLVNRQDIAGLSRAINGLLSDDQSREKLGRAGHERLLSEFAFERFESNLDVLLSSLL